MARTFPNSADYICAIENTGRFVLDPVLKVGRPRFGKDGQLLLYSGGFAKVFVIERPDQNSTYALRCWMSDIGEAARHYSAVSQCLAQIRLPYFTDFEYVPEGILVNGGLYPIVRMEWVEALSLREFIGTYRNCGQVLREAAEKFLAMAKTLHQREIAHGDLQSDNLKVRMNGDGPDFVLIDYDTLFVPDLAGTKINNLGVPGFQHPKRAEAPTATASVDYFAELVIYHTLHAVAEEPNLWEDCRMAYREKELIFSPEDFRSPVPTDRFRRLRNVSPLVSKLTLLLWNYTRCDFNWLIPIEEAVEICRASSGPTDTFAAMLKPKSEGWLLEWAGDARMTPPLPPKPVEFRFDDLIRPKMDSTPVATAPFPSEPTGSPFDDLIRPKTVTTPLGPQTSGPVEPDKTRNAHLLLIILGVILLLLVIYFSTR